MPFRICLSIMGGKLYGACWHLFLILADFRGVSRLDLCLRCPALGLALLLLPIAKNGAVNTRVQACVRSRAPLFLNPPCTQSCRVTQRSCVDMPICFPKHLPFPCSISAASKRTTFCFSLSDAFVYLKDRINPSCRQLTRLPCT